MKKLLIPLDGTERSMHSINLVKNLYKPEDVSITLLYVKEDAKLFIEEMDYSEAEKEMQEKVAEAVDQLENYDVTTRVGFVEPGREILRIAKTESSDIIVMTKSTKKGLTRMIGSVTNYVVKHSHCIVMIVPE
ncbi:universal stress protein [Fusobacterium sp. IOR10]|uniref:universal stress protein n=1 Tax=Fusobacterium sp. IOR10 TaxID=2665157 RepID=UPI0013CFE6E2|nr:universal stress protein [Fusobacterium sp. IOR10]